MSDVNEIAHIYNRNIARRKTPSTTLSRKALSETPGMNLAAYVGMTRKKTMAKSTEMPMVRAICQLDSCSSSSPAACAE